MDALKLVLEYVDLFGKYHVKVLANHLKGDVIAHIQFVANIDWQLQFPEPDFSISSATFNGLSSRRHRNALSLLMRVRGPYDGGIDYSTERLIKPAMDLLFDTPRYRFLRSVKKSHVFIRLRTHSLLGATPRRSTTRWIKICRWSLHVSTFNWMWAIDESLFPGSSEELTDSERASMAEAARLTLLAMIRYFDAEDGTRPLPKNTYVYGIHWDRRLLNIFV